MANRRDDILDAAIALLGEHGFHRLTHRGVDAAAGVPAGSTSNYFRTRDALVGAVVERFVALERQRFEDLAAVTHPRTPRELAETAAAFARQAVGPQRTVTLARYAILLETALQPELRTLVVPAGNRVGVWFANWMRAVGFTEPERHGPIIGAYFDGLVLHQLYNPDPEFDPAPRLVELIESLIRSTVEAT